MNYTLDDTYSHPFESLINTQKYRKNENIHKN